MNNKVIKAGVGYTVGNYMIKGLTFFSIPIFARLLEPTDYGVYNTYIAYECMLSMCIGLTLNTCQKKAKQKYGCKYGEFVSSCITLTLISMLAWLVIVNIFSYYIETITGFSRLIINLLVLHSTGSAILAIFNAYLSLNYSYVSYLLTAGINAIGNILLSVILILTVFKNERAVGRIIGTVVPIIFIMIFIVIYFYSKVKSAQKTTRVFEYLKYAVGYSVPLIPHGLSQVLLNQFDRLMINSFCGASQVGIYSFAYNIYSVIYVTTSSLDSVWSPWFFEMASGGFVTDIRKKATQYARLVLLFVIEVMFIAPEVIGILGTKEYNGADYCLMPIIVGGYFAYLYTIPVQIQYYYEKTKLIGIMSVLAALLNICLNAVFIPYFGYIAAAYTTAVTYIIYFGFHSLVSYKISKESYFEYKMLLLCGIVCVAVAAVVIILIPFTMIRWIIAIVIALIAIICFWRRNTYFKRISSGDGCK